jgi:Asp-tRNA(Asn)/Glu-tRNA(Gln) amidotransferase B subunit
MAEEWMINDDTQELVDHIIKFNPSMVKFYQEGDEEALNVLVGQTMCLSEGHANPTQVRDVLRMTILG